LADVFVSIEDHGYKEKVWRFVDLVFGSPFETPTRDEHFMYLASAASLRSGDLSRQVGAAIESERGDLISVGCNDVPSAGGGQYWPGPNDRRDHYYKSDSNYKRRYEIIADLVKKLKPGHLTDDQIALEVATLKGSPVFDITEYGRAVHAEMEALLSCSRVGVSPRGGAVYATTFPCHNCTRHVIAAGLKRVVYIEPYPKSQASELHSDAVEIKGQTSTEGDSQKVTFEPFAGVGPRRYLDLFSMRLGAGYPVEREKTEKQ
jgi:deoxycytidylate deaminase